MIDPTTLATSLAAAQRITRDYRIADRCLFPVQLLAVLASRNGGRVTMRDAADTLGVSTARATTVADALEDKGLAERVRDEGDRRVIVLRLTPAGEAAIVS